MFLYKWFTPMCSEGKHETGPTVTEKGKSLDDTMKLCKSTFSDGWMQSNKKLPIRNLVSNILFDNLASVQSCQCHINLQSMCVLYMKLAYHYPQVTAFYVFRQHIYLAIGFGGLEVACWPLVPKFTGSNPAEVIGFLRTKKSSARLPSEGK